MITAVRTKNGAYLPCDVCKGSATLVWRIGGRSICFVCKDKMDRKGKNGRA